MTLTVFEGDNTGFVLRVAMVTDAEATVYEYGGYRKFGHVSLRELVGAFLRSSKENCVSSRIVVILFQIQCVI